MLRIVSAAVAAMLCCAPVLAQEDRCPEASVISWLGGMILDQRTALPKPMARNYGAEAAYLTVRYSPSLSGESIEAFLLPLLEQDIRGIKDLVFAWTVVHQGLPAANGVFGADEVERLALSSPTTIRALVAAGTEATVIDAFGARGDESDSVAARAIAVALLDLPDTRKARLAALAEERGHFVVAGAIYATMLDAAAWPAFLDRVPHGLGEPLANMYAYFPLYAGNKALPSPDTSNPQLWAELQEVAAAGALQPEVEFINPYLNQTGYIDSALAAARALHDAVAVGSMAHDGAMDAGWLIAYRVLKGQGDEPAAGIDRTLAWLTIGQRPLRETAAEVLDWMLAVEALGPYIRGETEALPPAPAGPGGALAAEWPEWQRLAELVRSDPRSINPDNDRSLAMVTELLFAAGHYETVAAMLGTLGPSATSTGLAADFATRLDRQCESYLWHPAEALTLAGTPIYKFDDLGAGFETAATPGLTTEPPDAAEAASERVKN